MDYMFLLFFWKFESLNILKPLANSQSTRLVLQFSKPLYTSMASNFFDSDDNRIFHASEWIGVGEILIPEAGSPTNTLALASHERNHATGEADHRITIDT